MRPVLCMVTDRRRLGADWRPALTDRIAAAAHAGVHIIQIRERDLEGRVLSRLVEDAVRLVRGSAARIVVNDRVDIALASGADGVHLRGDSMPAPRVRAIAPAGFLIGRSVHSRDEAEKAGTAGGADYLICGTVFETVSKRDGGSGGVSLLAQVAAATSLPVLAIGGVTTERAREVAGAGAAGLAAIGLFADCPLDALGGLVRRVSAAFDTLGAVS